MPVNNPARGFFLKRSDKKTIDALSEEQRICLLMRHRDKKTYQAIADARQLTLGAAGSHIHKARAAVLRGRIRRTTHDAVEKPLLRATRIMATLLYALPNFAGRARMSDSNAIMKKLLKALPAEAKARDELVALGAVVAGVINASDVEERVGLAQHFCSLVLKNVAKELN